MCNEACLEFGRRHLLPDEITGKKVLEVGSMDVNGSLRAIVQRMAPSAYVGVDIATGPGVDVVCRVSELVARFGEAAFDTVISTEMLEHVRDWRVAVSNMKRVLKVGGTIVITTRSPGFPYHGYPYDFWRYEPDDIRTIFADMQLQALASDPLAPGVFLKARKPDPFVERDLAHVALHSVVVGGRTLSVTAWDSLSFKVRRAVSIAARTMIPRPLKAVIRAGLRRALAAPCGRPDATLRSPAQRPGGAPVRQPGDRVSPP